MLSKEVEQCVKLKYYFLFLCVFGNFSFIVTFIVEHIMLT